MRVTDLISCVETLRRICRCSLENEFCKDWGFGFSIRVGFGPDPLVWTLRRVLRFLTEWHQHCSTPFKRRQVVWTPFRSLGYCATCTPRGRVSGRESTAPVTSSERRPCWSTRFRLWPMRCQGAAPERCQYGLSCRLNGVHGGRRVSDCCQYGRPVRLIGVCLDRRVLAGLGLTPRASPSFPHSRLHSLSPRPLRPLRNLSPYIGRTLHVLHVFSLACHDVFGLEWACLGGFLMGIAVLVIVDS